MTEKRTFLDVIEDAIDKVDRVLPDEDEDRPSHEARQYKALESRSRSQIDSDQVIAICGVVNECDAQFTGEWDRNRLVKEIVRALRR